MRSCNRYHGFDVMLKPEEHVFWREAIKAKFAEGRRWERDDWLSSLPLFLLRHSTNVDF